MKIDISNNIYQMEINQSNYIQIILFTQQMIDDNNHHQLQHQALLRDEFARSCGMKQWDFILSHRHNDNIQIVKLK